MAQLQSGLRQCMSLGSSTFIAYHFRAHSSLEYASTTGEDQLRYYTADIEHRYAIWTGILKYLLSKWKQDHAFAVSAELDDFAKIDSYRMIAHPAHSATRLETRKVINRPAL